MARLRVVVCLLISCIAAAAAVGAPGDRTLRLISPGGSGAFFPFFSGASADGSKVWFTTDEPNPGLGDSDSFFDVYERNADGVLRLVSFGAGAFDALFTGASADGSRVWFETEEPNAALNDGDASVDVYERGQDGSLRVISFAGVGPAPGRFEGASADGSRVWFSTTGSNPRLGDTDANRDVYERGQDDSLRLVSFAGAGAFDALFGGASADGSRVWFSTFEPNAGLGDTDTARDVYERSKDGPLRLISYPGGGGFDGAFAGGSVDGSRVWFSTVEPNAGLGDNDTNFDIVERGTDGPLRLVSFSTAASASATTFFGASQNGSRVWVTTDEPNPGLGDTDTSIDVYERGADGTLRLVSFGAGAFDASFAGASADGSRVWFSTDEPNPGLGDSDSFVDVYERNADGVLRLVSFGTGAFDAVFGGASADGSRVWFTTFEPNAGSGDTDTARDVYERGADGSLRLLSSSAGASDAFFRGASRDGSRVWFDTSEQQPGLGDTDSEGDLFELRWGVPGNVVAPRVSGLGRVGQVLSCDVGTWAGDAFTLSRVWLRNGVPIAGQVGATYQVVLGDAGRDIRCRVTGVNIIGSSEATSQPVAIRPAPKFARRVVVAGALVVGTRARCGTTGLTGAVRRTFEWRRGTTRVARTERYRLVAADRGKRLTCKVTAVNEAGSSRSTSSATRIPVRCVVPPLRGRTLSVALERLGRAGCRSRVVRVTERGVPRGSVLRTNPAAGRGGPNGLTVTVTVRR